MLTRTSGFVVASVVLLSGCGTSDVGAGACATAARSMPAELTPPDLDEAREDAANLVIDVSSNRQRPVRLTVTAGSAVVLDIEVPAAAANCSSSPVYRYNYRLPARRVTVNGRTGDGQRGSATVDLGHDPRWVVVIVQDGFPLSVSSWGHKPQWG